MSKEEFLRQKIKDYYNGVFVDTVPDIKTREFGYGEFGKKISSRHLSFDSYSSLNHFLKTRVPFYISYSNALYKFPSARPMEKKLLSGADLIYEFDADDIPTDCKEKHDSWVCKECGAEGRGNVSACPECGSGVKVDEWVCHECLGETKRQTFSLIDMLESDFGFSDGIAVNFSGSKGYHVHIRSGKVRELSKSARLELLDYITATNLNLKSLGFVEDKVFLCPKKSTAKGWAKRLLDSIEQVLDKNDSALLAKMGLTTTRNAEKLLKEKQRIRNGMERGFLFSIGVNAKFWSNVLDYIKGDYGLGVDKQTSVDINKIIRIPDTLHGSTGLKATVIERDSLKEFDPLKDSVVLSGEEVKLSNVDCPEFFLGGEKFGPFRGDAELPMFAAFYLLARKNGELV